MKLKFKSVYLFSLALAAIGCSVDSEETVEKTNPKISETTARLNVAASRFYKPATAEVLRNEKNLITDYNVNANDDEDDSDKLNKAIEDLASTGGKIIIPRGKYYFINIKMKSNIHIEVEKGTTIFPTKGLFANRNHRIFNFGGRGQKKVENTSIVGKGGRFNVDLRGNRSKNLIVADLGEVDNFRLSNFNIKDEKTVFASILVSFTGKPGDAWPHNGIVENISQTNSHTGYGVIQGYAGDNILFKNLKCKGGVTLRLETDNLAMKEAKRGGLRQIFAKKIACTNGITPVMFSPHFMENGTVTIDDVTATGCAYGVRIEHGFIELFDKQNLSSREAYKNYLEGILGTGAVSSIYRRNHGRTWAARIANEFSEKAYNHSNSAVNGIKPGNFKESKVTNVKVIYKSSGAKIKQEFLDYLPCGERSKVCQPGPTGFEYSGPSLGATYDITKANGLGNYKVNVTTSQVSGFPNGYVLNVKHNTAKICSQRPTTINKCNGN